MSTIFTKKIGMTSKYSPEGKRMGVTVLSVLPMAVSEVRSLDKHGYQATQFKIDTGKGKGMLKEVRTKADLSDFKWEEVFQAGDRVKVSGISKGKGFAGVVKRHGFAGGPRTHGQSDRERAPGSIGQTTTPGRVYKGKRMAGRMGGVKVTAKNMKVVSVDAEKRQIMLSGSVPGNNKSLVTLIKI